MLDWDSGARKLGREGGVWCGSGGRGRTPQLHTLCGSSKPFPPLTGCCRTTSWEESPQRRCGSCRACSLCESLEGWAGEPASWGLTHSPGPPASASPPFLRGPLSHSVFQTACRSRLWFFSGVFVVVSVCMCTLVCVFGKEGSKPQPEDCGNGTSLGGATGAAVLGCLAFCHGAWGRQAPPVFATPKKCREGAISPT